MILSLHNNIWKELVTNAITNYFYLVSFSFLRQRFIPFKVLLGVLVIWVLLSERKQ
jgi:uncharacterized Tic20 family protein